MTLTSKNNQTPKRQPPLTYAELKQTIADNQHVPDYYQQLLLNADDILLDIALNGQTIVAKELDIAQSKLSVIKNMLVAYHNLDTTKA